MSEIKHPHSAPRPVIIDCDPGHDDAINLLLAMSSPEELHILGITAVAGNVPLNLTARTARLVCDIAGRTDIPVFAGCSAPLQRPLLTAERVHGASGIAGIDIVEPRCVLERAHAVDFLIETLRASVDDSITLVLTGPLTNIASALIKDPGIARKVAHIVLMGGAYRDGGNASPSAEFNMLVDPHAADTVFRCGRPITVMSLDVSYQAPATTARKERIRALGNAAGSATAAMLDQYNRYDTEKYGALGARLHDPCTVA
jgi:purine nucleosidase